MDIEPSIFAGMIEEDVGLKIRYIAIQILTAIDIAARLIPDVSEITTWCRYSIPILVYLITWIERYDCCSAWDRGYFESCKLRVIYIQNNLPYAEALEKRSFTTSANWRVCQRFSWCFTGLQMTFTEIRNTVISRMTAQTIIDGKDVLYPNAPTFDPSGKLIWARLSNIPGQAGVNEIGAGPIVYRTGIIIIQLFVPAGSGSKLITETADKLRELFEFQDDDRLSYRAVSSIAVGEKNGWFQLNLQIPYRAL